MTYRAFVIARFEALHNTGSNPEGMARWIASFLAMTGYLLLSAFCKPLAGFKTAARVEHFQLSTLNSQNML
jgi:hypothetical protein